MKRKKAQEHDEAIARAQADERRAQLLAEMRSHQATGGPPPAPPAESTPSVTEPSTGSESDDGTAPPAKEDA